MTYNEATESYAGQALLKKGYYNYLYALVPKAHPGTLDFSEIEGDWHETENDYTILIYWRPFGERYDRVAAVKTVNSIRDLNGTN